MTYISVLPQVFPHRVSLKPHRAIHAIEMLTRLDRTEDSSFALTVDGTYLDGMWDLWLTESSLSYLVGCGFAPSCDYPS